MFQTAGGSRKHIGPKASIQVQNREGRKIIIASEMGDFEVFSPVLSRQIIKTVALNEV